MRNAIYYFGIHPCKKVFSFLYIWYMIFRLFVLIKFEIEKSYFIAFEQNKYQTTYIKLFL